MTASNRLFTLVVVFLLVGCSGVVVETPATSPTDSVATPATGTPLPAPSGERVDVEIVHVVDGDTVDVRLPDGSEDTVRLVGIDTPEVHAENDPTEFEGVPDTKAGATCLREAGHNATVYVEERVSAGNVTLVFDPNTDRRGGYGRLLAYVYVGDQNLNYDLVATGHARVYDTDFVFREQFDTSEQRARSRHRGLWTCQQAG